jgi:mannose-6-phosphate isomerase-like protein (cupin superfamily)
MKGYEVLSLDELGRYPDPRYDGAPQLIPLRYELGLRAFGANAWTNGVGQPVVPRHSEESGNEELYVVVRGRVTFTVGDETLDAPAGTLVHVANGEVREAVAEDSDTIVLAVGATRGEPFTAHGWDEVVMAFAKARKGDVVAGRAMIDALIARQPTEWQGPYNAACFEALQGERERAFAHLRHAVEMAGDDVQSFAPGDNDLAILHDDPRWAELIAP